VVPGVFVASRADRMNLSITSARTFPSYAQSETTDKALSPRGPPRSGNSRWQQPFPAGYSRVGWSFSSGEGFIDRRGHRGGISRRRGVTGAPTSACDRNRRQLGVARRFLQGLRVHRLEIEQRGAELAGRQRSAQFEGPVSGWLSGDLVQLSFTARYEASTICYYFDGEIRDGKMSGTAVLGAASDQNHGIVNRGQFGTGRWQASRVG
jgi:hypothetical protein